MAIEVVVPMLGITIEKGKILRWLKSEGDSVQKGEPLFEVETDKVVTEVESPGTGVLKKILIPENVEVPVLTLVAVITGPNEELPEQYRPIPALVPPPPSRVPAPEKAPPEPSPAPRSRISAAGRDVLILGAGPGGYVSAIRAAQMGARVTLIERGLLGGTCLNWGCIPTKSFLADVKLYSRAKRSEIFTNGAQLSLDWSRMVSRKNRVVETLRNGVATLLKNQKVTLVQGQGRFLDSHSIEVAADGKRDVYNGDFIVIATGSRPASLPNVKIDGQSILSSDEILNLRELPQEIVVVGGGVIGVEFAMIFKGLGSKVTILEMLPQMIATEDAEVIQGLQRVMEKEGIQVITQAKVLQAIPQKGGVQISFLQEGKEEKVSAGKLLMAVGRKPNTEELDLAQAGVQRDGPFIQVNSRMETSVSGIYAIGDVTGKMMLAHAASAQGIVAVENMMGKTREMEYEKIPSCIYTFPEVASVGLKENEAKQRGYEVQVGKFPYGNSGKALAMGEAEGFVKIVAEKELGQILGVHILGERATDLIGEVLLAMKAEASIEDLGNVVKGHPTLSEMITEAALDWNGVALHLPKRT